MRADFEDVAAQPDSRTGLVVLDGAQWMVAVRQAPYRMVCVRCDAYAGHERGCPDEPQVSR